MQWAVGKSAVSSRQQCYTDTLLGVSRTEKRPGRAIPGSAFAAVLRTKPSISLTQGRLREGLVPEEKVIGKRPQAKTAAVMSRRQPRAYQDPKGFKNLWGLDTAERHVSANAPSYPRCHPSFSRDDHHNHASSSSFTQPSPSAKPSNPTNQPTNLTNPSNSTNPFPYFYLQCATFYSPC